MNNRMKIEVNEEDGYSFTMNALLQLEEDMPENNVLTKAIKSIAHYLMIPTDWEEMYEEDYLDYDIGEKG